MSYWLLPEFIEDILPPEAMALEKLRQQLLNMFDTHGYDLVIPPLIEYVDSLLLDASPAADLRTFRLLDQMSGRMMGLRADITPQVARIDAHLLGKEGIARLCYAGSVVHTLPSSYLSNRQPIQIGAELFGSEEIEADLEVLRLAIDTLKAADIQDFVVDIGHMGIVNGIFKRLNLDENAHSLLYDRLKVKDLPEIEKMSQDWSTDLRQAILALARLYGGVETLERAHQMLPAWPEITQGLEDLQKVIEALKGKATISIDLSQLRSFRYHTGLVFAFYSPSSPELLCRGGRYDAIGEIFGRKRPATGFTVNLRALLRLPRKNVETRECIYCPPIADDKRLTETVRKLREDGYRVIEGFHRDGRDKKVQGLCCRELRQIGGAWQVCQAVE